MGWNVGILEGWNGGRKRVGILEYWKSGRAVRSVGFTNDETVLPSVDLLLLLEGLDQLLQAVFNYVSEDIECLEGGIIELACGMIDVDARNGFGNGRHGDV